MSWAIGFDNNWNRDIGYGVPAQCDHPECTEEIDRGLGCVCGGRPYGGHDDDDDSGCGLFFCGKHGGGCYCERCKAGQIPFDPKPDLPVWLRWKLRHYSWKQWRDENPDEVAKIRARLRQESERA